MSRPQYGQSHLIDHETASDKLSEDNWIQSTQIDDQIPQQQHIIIIRT